MRSLAAEVNERHGGIDVLVNNAGIALDGFDGEVARRTVDANYFGPLRMVEAFEPLLRSAGRIVMVSSGVADRSRLSKERRRALDAATDRDRLGAFMNEFVADVAAGRYRDRGWPDSAYCVSKIGLNRLTEILGSELAGDGRGLLCNAACPGWVRTDMGGPSAPRSPEEGADTPLWLALLGDDGPQGGFFRDREPATW